MKKILALLLLIPMAFCFSCKRKNEETQATSLEENLTYLVFGLDDAAMHTDVLFLCSYQPAQKRLSVLQIPCDTYYRSGYAQNKINQIFASIQLSGDDINQSANILTKQIEDAFGISLDGYLGVTTETFRKTVDALGGVKVELPRDMVFNDGSEEGFLNLRAGENHLNGEDAERFVRFRKGYKTGDLGRINAQKIFLSGLVNTIRKTNKADLLKTAVFFQNNAVTNVKTVDIVSNYLQFKTDLHDMQMLFLTMPGEACLDANGISYYVLNKKGCEAVLLEYADAHGSFDPERRFSDSNDVTFENIYTDMNDAGDVFDQNSLDRLKILCR